MRDEAEYNPIRRIRATAVPGAWCPVGEPESRARDRGSFIVLRHSRVRGALLGADPWVVGPALSELRLKGASAPCPFERWVSVCQGVFKAGRPVGHGPATTSTGGRKSGVRGTAEAPRPGAALPPWRSGLHCPRRGHNPPPGTNRSDTKRGLTRPSQKGSIVNPEPTYSQIGLPSG